jgi:transposase
VIVCIDPFHVAQWATDALDVVRRQTWNDARNKGISAEARQLKGARFALWRNPEDLTEQQQAKLSRIKTANGPLYRSYLLKEQLRQILHVKHERAIEMLQAWCQWASRSRLTAFIDLARRIRKNEPGILNALLNRLSNGLVESTIHQDPGPDPDRLRLHQHRPPQRPRPAGPRRHCPPSPRP